ncbi:MAG TPA: hypothetical protein VLH79_03650 [Chthonomonadales bacterium]|nr:hypothetical protein [Chthonomonadales bacterium]
MHRTTVSLALLLALAAAPGMAQQRALSPRIGYLYPAGARVGQTVQVTAGGQALMGARAAYVTGGGVSATVEGYDRPMTQREVQQIRERLEQANQRLFGAGLDGRARTGLRNLAQMARIATEAGVTEEQLRKLREFVQSRNDPRRQQNSQIAEKVTLRVSVEPDAAPGPREVRLLTPLGLSNPLRFHVGRLPEHAEAEPNDPEPNDLGAGLPAVVNGQILPGDVDRFVFAARKGASLVVRAEARELLPYLADAVPGWFQAVAVLRDPRGRELAFCDDFRFHPDPAFAVTIPEDGRYALSIADAIYRGREDFVYRITVGEVPVLTGVFPLGGTAGSPAALEARGWNLPSTRIRPPTGPPGIRLVSLPGTPVPSNRVPFAVDAVPSVAEREPNDAPAGAQALRGAVAVDGRIGRPGDVDVYRVLGKPRSKVVAEVAARRLGSPLDPTLELTDAAGRRLAFNDDFVDRAAGLITHHADSRVEAALPASGVAFLTVRDAQRMGGPDHAYRLRVGPPRPDFDLRVTPASVTVRAGARAAVTVYALRRDGFDGPIALRLAGAPEGFAIEGGAVAAGEERVRLTLTAPASGPDEPLSLRLEGVATVDGREVVREAKPAEDMMQAFAYRHLVPADEWAVAVLGRAPTGPTLAVRQTGPVAITAGGTVRVSVTAPLRPLSGEIGFSLSEPPEGVSIAEVARGASGLELVLRADASKAKTGTRGNLIVEAYREVPRQRGNARSGATARRVPLGLLPAIPFEVVAR